MHQPPLKNPFLKHAKPAPRRDGQFNVPFPQHNQDHRHGPNKPRVPGKWDVSNRPAGDKLVQVEIDVDTLKELVIGFAFINNADQIAPSEEDKERLKDALSNVLHSTRTKYRGRHPKDIEFAEVTGSKEPITLYECLLKLRDLV